MRLYIAGQKAFGAQVFEALAAAHEIAGVSAPARGRAGPDRLRASAERAGIPWLEAGRLNAETLPKGVDLIVCAHAHDFVGRKTRHRAALGAIGYHPSLLPRHRGRDAVRWTLHMRDAIAGGTVFRLTDNIDAGPVLAQRHVFVSPDDDAASLWREKLAPLGVELLVETAAALELGAARARPQDESCASWEPSWERAPLRRPDLDLIEFRAA